jgi:hypothetical protein
MDDVKWNKSEAGRPMSEGCVRNTNKLTMTIYRWEFALTIYQLNNLLIKQLTSLNN